LAMRIIRPLFHTQASLRFEDSHVKVMTRNRANSRCINNTRKTSRVRMRNFLFGKFAHSFICKNV